MGDKRVRSGERRERRLHMKDELEAKLRELSDRVKEFSRKTGAVSAQYRAAAD